VETAVLTAILGAVCFLNAPTVAGLYRYRDESHKCACRMVALALLMRMAATSFVLQNALSR
jgi:hypothetical protein